MASITIADAVGVAAASKAFLQPDNQGETATGKLGEFIAQMRQRTVARSNLFEVVITPPYILASNPTKTLIPLYASDASIPNLFLETLDLKRFGTGPNEKLPYSAQFTDMGVMMIGDGQGDIYKFFYRWLQGIVLSDAHMTSTNFVSINRLSPYEVNFKEDYRGTVNIIQYDENRNVILNYELSEAYPTFVGGSPLSWGDENNLQKFPINFTFMQAKLTNLNEQKWNPATGETRPLSPFEKLYKFGTAAQVVFSTKKPNSVGDVINVVSNAKVILKGLGGTI